MKKSFLILTITLTALSFVHAGEIGFDEKFALAADRSVPLKELIPGTEDYYYYHCLHYQHIGDFNGVERMLKPWIKRNRYSARVHEIMDRQALLTYNRDSKASLARIIDRLNLRFSHQRILLDHKPDFPTTLNQDLISWATLQKREYGRRSNLTGFEQTAMDILVRRKLNPDRRRSLLSRINRPDHPNMAKLVVDDLNHKYSRGFGSHQVHGQLLLSQLNECLRLKPDLIKNTNFINAYLKKLRPNDDVDWEHSPKVREAYYNRLWSFARTLPPSQNSLKAHVLFHRLAHDRSLGIYNRARFMEYIKLPRNVAYINAKYVSRQENRHVRANLSANYKTYTMLATVSIDEPLVRDFLSHFLVDARVTGEFASYIESKYLKRVFAETKILNGTGDMESWYSMLSPSEYRALKERIDIDFLPTNKELITSDTPVSLIAAVKNVKKLIIKTYEINTSNFYRDRKEEITTAIDLDGLVANNEKVVNYDQVPLRRHIETFDFPGITKPGVYVVELIGNGKSSRALIRKGRLTFAERAGSGGHVFTIFDDRNEQVKTASLWMDGHEYKSDEDGQIAVPFSTKPDRQKIIITSDGFSELHSFVHAEEKYALTAGFFVDREALIDGATANLIVRPQLTLNGRPVDLDLLEQVILTISSSDREGIRSSSVTKDFKLYNDKESVHEFKVPEKLSHLSFTLTAKVENLSKAKKEDLSSSDSAVVNSMDKTAHTEDIHLRHTDSGYVVELLGKTGEARRSRPVHIEIKHRDFRQTVAVTLMSDRTGRVSLGALKDIASVSVRLNSGHTRNWRMVQDIHSHESPAHAAAGEAITIPFMADEPTNIDDAISLLETRSGTFVRDVRDHVKLSGGFMVLTGLEPGDYSLYLKRSAQARTIRVTGGKRVGMHAVSRDRQLDLGNSRPLQIVSAKPAGKVLRIQLRNTTADTRVHVAATRYIPDASIYSLLGAPRVPWLGHARTGLPITQYLSGRNIGDEYRYVLERKYAVKRPGNMLRRPSLLLNPWSLRKTDTDVDYAAAGEMFKGLHGARTGGARSAAEGRYGGRGAGGGAKAPNLDFLPEPALIFSNLTPDKNGIVEIALEELGPRQQIHVAALNRNNAVYRETALAPEWTRYRDKRMARILDPAKHFAEQKLVTAAAADKPFVLPDARTSKMEVYDSLTRVYGLYSTLSSDATLKEFGFILEWPGMKDEKKREMYSKYACHELNYFLARRDPEFFKKVIRPYLKHKKDKTFMDHWLLGDSLSAYLKPWSYGRLNIVERVLLGQSIKAERNAAARHVKDRFDLIPPNIEEFNRLFKTAIQGSALETEGLISWNGKNELHLLDSSFGDDAGGFLGGDSDNIRQSSVARRANAPAPALKSYGAKVAKPASEPADEMMLELGEEVDSDYASKKDARWRGKSQRLYRILDKTEEWVENNYYHLPIERQLANLVPVSGFWKDYAGHDVTDGFLTVNIAEASRSFTEMMFALSVLDLPFTSPEHKTDVKDVTVTLTPAGDVVIFHKEINESTKVPERQLLLVGQNFFAFNDRYYHKDNERFDKFVTDEFLTHRVYGAQIVLSNPSSTPRKVDVLLQIPKGAMPVKNGFFTRSRHMVVGPYATQTIEYHFYFPFPGEYAHFPVHAAQRGDLIAFTEPVSFNVVNKLSKTDTASWDYISQHGSEGEVLRYLKDNNIDRLNMDLIAFRMRNKGFYGKTLSLLAKRHVYNQTLWSYGLHHNDVPAIREYLQGSRFAGWVGTYIDSPLLTLDPVTRHDYQHKEYWPLVNARTYQLGAKRKILNTEFFKQYTDFMKYLRYRPALTDADMTAVAYAMMLQDRVEEGLQFFDKINPAKIPSIIPYDYMKTYVAFYREDPALARTVASKHKDHPVDHWRKRFEQVLAQVDEIKGGKAKVTDKEDRNQQQAKLADTTPSFEFKVEDRKIAIDYQNLTSCRINYYLMDVELMFSKNPFVKTGSERFAIIQPNHTEVRKLSGKTRHAVLKIPDQFRDSNIMVEITAAGIRKAEGYYPHSLAIQIMENYGQLRIATGEGGKPLSKVYVKAYARMKNGEVKYYKDGYTDMRGRFDYTSLSTQELNAVDKFSLLIMSEEHGAVVREAKPPKQ